MYIREIKALLPQLNIVKDRLAKYTTFGIGGSAVIVLPHSVKQLVQCINTLSAHNIEYKVIGNGSNLLAPSSGTDLVIVCTRDMKEEISCKDDEISVACGANINQVIMWCMHHGLSGLESLYGIPATVGGMVAMNASAFGCAIFDHLLSVEVLLDGKVKKLKPCDIEVGVHKTSLLNSNAVVLNAYFKLVRESEAKIREQINYIISQRLSKQPKGKSAGSVFSNTEIAPAGKLIDDAGLKGMKVGRACVSEKHANFIINNGASDGQVKKLISLVQEKVKQKFNVTLQREIEYIGETDELNR